MFAYKLNAVIAQVPVGRCRHRKKRNNNKKSEILGQQAKITLEWYEKLAILISFLKQGTLDYLVLESYVVIPTTSSLSMNPKLTN